MIDNTSLTVFRAIAEFITDLAEQFSKIHKPLRLYSRLISQTTLVHVKPIEKHIEAFKNFCIQNRDSILEKKPGKLKVPKISYSDHVYVNMETIFNNADRDTTEIIWRHILTISAFVDQAGHAKQVLNSVKEADNSTGNEVNFLTDIIDQVNEKVGNKSSPQEAIAAVMSSGIFNNVINSMGSGMENGTLDMGKLLGSVTQLMSGLDDYGDPEISKVKNTVSNLADNLGKIDQKNPNPSDLVGMLGPVLGMMGGLPEGVQVPGSGASNPSIKLEDGQSKEDGLKNALDEEYRKAKQAGVI